MRQAELIKSRVAPPTRQSPSAWLPWSAVFLGTFGYVWLRIDPALEYFTRGVSFLKGASFLEPFLKRPGGLADYAAAFLAQLDSQSWLGALVFAALATMAYSFTHVVIHRILGPGLSLVLSLVPVFVLLVLRNHQAALALVVGVDLVLVLGLAAACLKIPSCGRGFWLGILASGTAFLFYIAGIWAALGMVLLGLLSAIGRNPKSSFSPVSPKPGRALRLGSAILLPLAGAATVWFTLDSETKALAEIDYYCGHRDYERVIRVARHVKALDLSARVRVELALFHAGRLADDFFSCPNLPGRDLLPGLRGGMDSCRAQSRTLFELGLIGDAEHMAHEALEWEGTRPDLLKLLAQINVIKGRPKAASIFLNVLGKIPFQERQSQACLRKLHADALLSEDPDLATVRSRLLATDVPHAGFPFEALMQALLESNPRNQMAFEYLLAYYLANRDLLLVREHLGQLNLFGYHGIPRTYEEALLLFDKLKGTHTVLPGREVRPETIRRFKRFSDAMDQKLYSTAEGRQQMARDFGDTYWYYYFDRPADSQAGTLKAAGA
jgi:hypothetical protein